jgi:hypothetical protein
MAHKSPLPLLLLLAVFAALAVPGGARAVTLRNDVPRLDVNGDIIDCHSGMILKQGGTYFMYGEHYGNTTGFGPSPPALYPKIVVYTSPDLVSWTPQGFAISNWSTAPYGTFFTPWAVYNPLTQRFVLWFNAYLNGCCAGGWGVATSTDGIHFDIVSLNEVGKYAVVDCNGLFVDSDGTGYMIYTSEAEDHKVSIEKLTPDFTHLAGVNFGLFPDRYVEGAVLFKRGSLYYVGYGSCCCFCRGGSGWVVYSAPAIAGPWTRQSLDVNCNLTAPGDICGAYGDRVTGGITVPAQGIGLSRIPLAAGGEALVWHGERWLSAKGNNPSCPDECRPETGECAEPSTYIKGEGFAYWIPLQFTSAGAVLPFESFVDSFELDIA